MWKEESQLKAYEDHTYRYWSSVKLAEDWGSIKACSAFIHTASLGKFGEKEETEK